MSLSVAVSESPPLGYQWFFNSQLLAGQTNYSLQQLNVTTNQAGAYWVIVTNLSGSSTSHVATLRVGWLPMIVSQPSNQTWVVGRRGVLAAKVAGLGPLSLRWQFQGTNLPFNIITTLAGNGRAGLGGDGGTATASMLSYPSAVVGDAQGNVFIVDAGNLCLRKVTPDGIITTLAAQLAEPSGLALGANGSLFVSDAYKNVVQRLDPNGQLVTIAGNGSRGFSGDGGPATSASLFAPGPLVVDSQGNLLIADAHNSRVRRVDTNGIITTVAGMPSNVASGDGGPATNATMGTLQGLALDSQDNLYIADTFRRVRKVDAYGIISTYAGNPNQPVLDGVLATNCNLTTHGLAFDAFGDLFIADTGNNRIRRVDPYGYINAVAGTNLPRIGDNGDGLSALLGSLSSPTAVAVDAYGRLLIAESGGNRIRCVGPGQTLVVDAVSITNAGDYRLIVDSPYGSVTSVVANVSLAFPPGLLDAPIPQKAGPGGSITFSATASGTAPLSYQWTFHGTNLPGQTSSSMALSNVQWSDAGTYALVITNNYGAVTSQVPLIVNWPPALTNYTTNVTVIAGSSAQLSLGVAGEGPFTYQWFCNGTNVLPIITTVAGNGSGAFSGDGIAATNSGMAAPDGIAIDAFGRLFIAEYGFNRIRMVDTNGLIYTYAGTSYPGYLGNGGQALAASFQTIEGIAVDKTGAVYASEYANAVVRKINTNGIVSLIAGTGVVAANSSDGLLATNTPLNHTTSVAVDNRGNTYFTDYSNHRIRKVGADGLLRTVAGNGTNGLSGDGGPATNACLGSVVSLTVDSAGNLFFSDTSNNRVRRVDTNGIITTVAGGGTDPTQDSWATNCVLMSPYGITLDPVGNLYVIEPQSGRIRKVDTAGGITTVAGQRGTTALRDNGPALYAGFSGPKALALDPVGNLYVSDEISWRVRKIHLAGDPALSWPAISGESGGTYSVIVSSPFGQTVCSNISLTVITPPMFSATRLNSDGSLTLGLSNAMNSTTRLYGTTNLTPPVTWVPLMTNTTGGMWEFTDTNAANSLMQFYRLSMP